MDGRCCDMSSSFAELVDLNHEVIQEVSTEYVKLFRGACGSKYINSCTATYNLCVKLFRGACGSKFPSSVFVSLPPGQALSRSLLI